MATYTDNYNLVLPKTEDTFDVEDYNENFNTLDATLATLEEKVDALSDTPTSIIKSIQRVTYSIAASTSSGSVNINKIDVAKSFVIFERLQDSYSQHIKINYTLNATSISFTHDSNSTSSLKNTLFGFWIIEFN